MAAVAHCPNCKQELVVPDGSGADEWINCPTCRASMLVSDTEPREHAEEAPLDDAVAASANESLGGTSLPPELRLEIDSEVSEAGPRPDAPTDDHAPLLSDGTADDDKPRLTDSGETAATRIDKWFRAADTIPEVPPVAGDASPSGSPDDETPVHDSLTSPADEVETAADTAGDQSAEESETAVPEWSAPFSAELPSVHTPTDEDFDGEQVAESTQRAGSGDSGATTEFSADSLDDVPAEADFEIEEVDRDRPTWDDPERMEQLLADVDAAPAIGEPQAPTNDSEQLARGDEADREAIPPIVATPHKKRRRRSIARLVAGCIVAGVVGIALGAYALVWILGPRGDFLEIARFIPAALLPEKFQTAPAQLAADSAASQHASQNDLESALPAGLPERRDEPAEVTASYEAPASTTPQNLTASEQDRYADDRYATPASATQPIDSQPPAFDDVPAEPLAHPTALIASAPSYTTEQLATAIEIARQAQPGLVSGDLNDQAVQRTKGLSYTKLSYLAELATFVDSAAQPQRAQALQQDVEALFRNTMSNPQTRNEISYIAAKWMDSPHRSIGGVFLAGSIASQRTEGPVVEFQIDSGSGAPLTVLAPAAMAERLNSSGQPVGIVGSIIDDPAARISGYTGTAPRAIWAGMLIPLE